MRVKYPNLTRALKEQDLTQAQFALILGISKATLQRRLNGESEWKLHEVAQICQYFERWDASQLFLRLDTKS